MAKKNTTEITEQLIRLIMDTQTNTDFINRINQIFKK